MKREAAYGFGVSLEFRRVLFRSNGWFTGCTTPEDFADAAAATVAQGYTALKFDPFTHEMQPFHTGYVSGAISAGGEELGMDKVAAVREAVGSKIEVLIDAHGHYNVPTAIRIGNRLAEHSVTWYEEPVPPENKKELGRVAQSTSIPIVAGERVATKYEFAELFDRQAADILPPAIR